MEQDVMRMLAIGIVMGLGMLGPALGLGMIGFSALAGISRNPEAKSAIQTNMILVAAFTEAIAIYVLIIGIMLVTAS